MREENSVGHGQAHARPLPYGLCGEIGFEDPAHDRGTDAGPGIADPDDGPGFSGCKGGVGGGMEPGEVDGAGDGDGEDTLVFGQILHGVARIEEDVQDSLLQLNGVPAYEKQFAPRMPEVQRNGTRGGSGKEKIEGGPEERGKLDLGFVVVSAPGKAQKLLRQVRGFVRDGVDAGQMPFHVRIVHGMHVADDIQMSLHGMEEIVEVVSDPPGQTADGFHPLPMGDLFLPLLAFPVELLPLRHVPSENDEHGIACDIHRRKREFRLPSRAGHDGGTDPGGADLRRAGVRIVSGFGNGPEEGLGHIGEFLDRDRSPLLLGLQSRQADGRGIGVEDRALAVHGNDHIRGAPEKETVPLFTLPEIVFESPRPSGPAEEGDQDIQRAASARARFFRLETGEIEAGDPGEDEDGERTGQIGKAEFGDPAAPPPVADGGVEKAVQRLPDEKSARDAEKETASPVAQPLVDDGQEKEIQRKGNHVGGHGVNAFPEERGEHVGDAALRTVPGDLRHGDAGQIGIDPQRRNEGHDEPLGLQRAVRDVNDHDGGKTGKHEDSGGDTLTPPSWSSSTIFSNEALSFHSS